MRKYSSLALVAALSALSVGCTYVPSGICQMPQNRHLWQGLDVEWQGQVIDLATHHGGGIYFTDLPCGAAVPIDPDVVPSLYELESDYLEHAAVADFEIVGRLSFQDGIVVLQPSAMTQTSSWQTDQNGGFEAYLERRIEAYRAAGLLPPE